MKPSLARTNNQFLIVRESFHLGVISFTERNNHREEATVLKTIHNWHKAVDGRGLNEATRSDYCKAMLDWILEAWIPYLKTEQPDYSFTDVNR